MSIPQRVEVTLDLQGAELVIVTMLANLGAAVLSGDKEAASDLGNMLMGMERSEQIAAIALDKLEASLKVAKDAIVSEKAE